MLNLCALCSLQIQENPIRDEDNVFCCPGCRAVFNILSLQDLLGNFKETSLFQQAIKAGLISNAAAQQIYRQEEKDIKKEECLKLHIQIENLWCPACAELIQLVLLKEKGIRHCVVDYGTDLASVEFSPFYISKDRIFALISSFGYHPNSLETTHKTSTELSYRLLISLFCSFNIMMFSYPLYVSYFYVDAQAYGLLFAWLSFFCAIPVMTYGAWPIFRRFFTSLYVGVYGMETLVVMSTSTAFFVSIYKLYQGETSVYFDSMAVIITLVLLGKIIETKAKISAKSSLLHLSRSIPNKARKRMKDGTFSFVPVKEIQIDDQVMVCTGEKIPLDGIVMEGNASCDESLMTGEAVPVEKTFKSSLLGGSILLNGMIIFQVTRKAEESTLHHLLNLVRQDLGHKSPYTRLVDPIVKIFIPLVLSLALLIGIVCISVGIKDPWLRIMSILLISCPCAIGIAVPLAEAYLMHRLASLGAIVRNRRCLQLLGRESIFVFDKTGTITEGKFQVLSGLEKLSQEEMILLKSLTFLSHHPIACAISHSIDEQEISLKQVEEIAGCGMKAVHNEKSYFLGSSDFLEKQGLKLTSAIPSLVCEEKNPEVGTTVFFGYSHLDQKVCLTKIVLGDKIRPGIKELWGRLSYTQKILLSGDSSESVTSVAKSCEFDTWHAKATPQQKREIILNLKKTSQIICMIGDGINDAPALTAADIGISMVRASDISIQVSDILLTTDQLEVLASIQAIGRKANRIIKQNLFWAFFYNIIGIGLAIDGVLSPIFASFAMVTSSLMILFNSQRLCYTHRHLI